jgi:hypothetical protein
MLTRLLEHKEAAAFAAAASVYISYKMSGVTTDSRIVRANSGTMPACLENQTSAPKVATSSSVLRRRPSWETKFEGPELSTEMIQSVNEGAKSRLQRRPSWAEKFVGEGYSVDNLSAVLVATASSPSSSTSMVRFGIHKPTTEHSKQFIAPPHASATTNLSPIAIFEDAIHEVGYPNGDPFPNAESGLFLML